MATYEQSMEVLSELFHKDSIFVLATSSNDVVSARAVDTYFDDGAFWVVTYAMSRKVKDIESNPHVALCNDFYTFQGIAANVGHPRKAENQAIREKLIVAFEPWYFMHNSEDDEHMCYVRIQPESGFFHKDGIGYRVDFLSHQAEECPFTPDIIMPS